MKSWKTTVLGLGTIFAALAPVLKSLATAGVAGLGSINWETTVAALSAGFGLLFARDNNVTSEQAGAGKTSEPSAAKFPLVLLIAVLAFSFVGCAYVSPNRARTFTESVATNGVITRETRDTKSSSVIAIGDARQVVDKIRASNGKTHSLGMVGAEQETTTAGIPPILDAGAAAFGTAFRAYTGLPPNVAPATVQTSAPAPTK